jgi:hypothetical protein
MLIVFRFLEKTSPYYFPLIAFFQRTKVQGFNLTGNTTFMVN